MLALFSLSVTLTRNCEGKVTQLYSGCGYKDMLVKNGVHSSSSNSGDPKTLAGAARISYLEF